MDVVSLFDPAVPVSNLVVAGIVFGVASHAVLFFAGWVFGLLWQWLDDRRLDDATNFYNAALMRLLGYRLQWDDDDGSSYYYREGDGDYERDGATVLIAGFAFFPAFYALVLLSIREPVLAVVIPLTVTLLFTARFVIRLRKDLAAHKADKEAHK